MSVWVAVDLVRAPDVTAPTQDIRASGRREVSQREGRIGHLHTAESLGSQTQPKVLNARNR